MFCFHFSTQNSGDRGSSGPVSFGSNPMPVMPDCQGAARFVSGSKTGLVVSRRFCGKFVIQAVLIVSSQPSRTSRATIQSVTTMRSHPVGWPAWRGACSRT